MRDLAEWLAYIERQHPKAIALGLDRVAAVRARLGAAPRCAVFVVGGTNGKGSTSAMLESILRCAGYRTGLYTSPHLLRYNERVRIDSNDAPDAALCEAFAAVEQARADTPLTYFEYGTLAAAWLFAREPLDAWILEVGLGGRLDAVNVFDADCALLTSIDMDHMDYLGPTREDIGREKAGIFRAGRPAVVADAKPPQSVLDAARSSGARLLLGGRDFGFSAGETQWVYWGPGGKRPALAYPALRGPIQLLPRSRVSLCGSVMQVGRRLHAFAFEHGRKFGCRGSARTAERRQMPPRNARSQRAHDSRDVLVAQRTEDCMRLGRKAACEQIVRQNARRLWVVRHVENYRRLPGQHLETPRHPDLGKAAPNVLHGQRKALA